MAPPPEDSGNPQSPQEILAPLSNPTRLSILKIIGEQQPVPYSKILEQLGLESGSFYWHVSKMEHLITQDPQKRYVLSEKGKAAYQLLIGTSIEEQEKKVKINEIEEKTKKIAEKIFGIHYYRGLFEILIITILWAYSLEKLQAITLLGVTETFDNLSTLRIILFLILSVSLLTFINRSVLLLLGWLRIVQPKTSLKIRFSKVFSLKAMVWSAFCVLSFSILPVSIAIFFENANPPSFVVFLISFFQIILLLSLTTMLMIYVDNLSIRDAFLVNLTFGYLIMLITILISSNITG